MTMPGGRGAARLARTHSSCPPPRLPSWRNRSAHLEAIFQRFPLDNHRVRLRRLKFSAMGRRRRKRLLRRRPSHSKKRRWKPAAAVRRRRSNRRKRRSRGRRQAPGEDDTSWVMAHFILVPTFCLGNRRDARCLPSSEDGWRRPESIVRASGLKGHTNLRNSPGLAY